MNFEESLNPLKALLGIDPMRSVEYRDSQKFNGRSIRELAVLLKELFEAIEE